MKKELEICSLIDVTISEDRSGNKKGGENF